MHKDVTRALSTCLRNGLSFMLVVMKRNPVKMYVESDLYSEDGEKACAMMCELITEARQ